MQAQQMRSSVGRTWRPFRAAPALVQQQRRARRAAIAPPPEGRVDIDQRVRTGDTEFEFVELQANKPEDEQRPIAEYLTALPTTSAVTADVCIVGGGPAGLALAAALGRRGVAVCLAAPESKFTNNYGVWVDEFSALGLEGLLDHTWPQSLCYFLDQEKRIDRAYGRVNRTALRHHLLSQCAAHGVQYIPAAVTAVDTPAGGATATARLEGGGSVAAPLVTLAGGAVSAKFLKFEDDAPPVASQTAYGVTAVVEGYSDAYPEDAMLFMDYRRAHSGMWAGTGDVLTRRAATGEVAHPNWSASQGTCNEAPSFLYAMPLNDGTVFLEETCLVARPTLPFAVLKRRLERRCETMGLTIKEVRDEEYSFIPVGGPMPVRDQPLTAFGAAANLVHPATGYSITRMLEESEPLADTIAAVLPKGLPIEATAAAVWDQLWPMEKRRQASFHIFGMELLATLDVGRIHEFFETFFDLPDRFWRGFLATKLSSLDLAAFAVLTFVQCSMGIRLKLMQHLVTDPSGRYMLRTYAREALSRLGDSSKPRDP